MPATETAPARKSIHVLLVDDDPALRKAMALRLEARGLRTATACCGEDALDVFEREQADLVVLDVNMPDMDGFEVCRRIKAVRDVPVIFVTGEQKPHHQPAHAGNRQSCGRVVLSGQTLRRLAAGQTDY